VLAAVLGYEKDLGIIDARPAADFRE